jgi:hypothetical protein
MSQKTGVRAGQLAWFGVAAVAMLSAAASAAELRPSWECLPAETAAMVRVPHGAELVETLRDSTKFGAVALRPDRLEGLWQLLVEQSEQAEDGEGDGQSFADWEASLEKYGLATSDLAAVFGGDVGAGLVVRPREGLPPLTMLLAWGEPGGEIAGRLLAAVRRRLEDAAGEADGPAPRRLDLELAGHEVVSAIVPVMGLDTSDIDLNGLADGDEEAAGLPTRLEQLRARLKDAKRVQTGQTHSLYAVLGDRLLYGTTFPAAAGDDAEPDFDAVSGGDEAAEIFAAFLAAHAGSDEPPLAGVLREPALAAAAPTGLPVVEAVAMPRVLLATAGGDKPEVAARLGQLGLDDIGSMAWRQTFDAGRWRSALAATLPEPRHGLLAMLDQPCDASEVPPFVTRETVSFTQISLDLGKAFAAVRETLLDASGSEQAEQLANIFNVADVQATTWLGGDVATVLSGLGSRHWLLSFPPRIGAALAEARAARAAGGGEIPGADSLALVWQVADEAPFLKLLGRLAPLAGGQLEEEQGFQSLRIPGGAAACVGRNHLVLAVGKGTLEKVLAAIRNPPAGDVSWRESDALRQARRLIEMPPGRMFGVGDATATGGSLGTLRELAAGLEPDDVEQSSRKLLAAGQKLLPTADEMEGLFGVGGTVLRMTDAGLVLESAWEMPPP